MANRNAINRGRFLQDAAKELAISSPGIAAYLVTQLQESNVAETCRGKLDILDDICLVCGAILPEATKSRIKYCSLCQSPIKKCTLTKDKLNPRSTTTRHPKDSTCPLLNGKSSTTVGRSTLTASGETRQFNLSDFMKYTL